MIGLLNIDKPAGMTSHDVVAVVRRGIGIKKIGHAGTLDPMATGVLILCIDRATRLSQYVMKHDKTYEAKIRLGIETDTYDADGQVVASSDQVVNRVDFEAALEQFRGDINQMPPMYSAIKKGGKKLYEMARAGKSVELEPRPVTIHQLELMRWDFPFADIQVICAAGTYIRSLAYDIGQTLGVGAHLTALRRTRSGAFSVEDATSLGDLQTAFEDGDWNKFLLPPNLAVADMPRLDLSTEQVKIVQNGGFLPRLSQATQFVSAFSDKGELVAILEPRGEDFWKPRQVLLTE